MKYTLKFVSKVGFYYPRSIGAYNDFGAGEGPEGSYLVLHMTSSLIDAMFYDTPEQAAGLLEVDIWGFDSERGFDIFTPLGAIGIPNKTYFKRKLQDK